MPEEVSFSDGWACAQHTLGFQLALVKCGYRAAVRTEEGTVLTCLFVDAQDVACNGSAKVVRSPYFDALVARALDASGLERPSCPFIEYVSEALMHEEREADGHFE
jgi:hypothetical protein